MNELSRSRFLKSLLGASGATFVDLITDSNEASFAALPRSLKSDQSDSGHDQTAGSLATFGTAGKEGTLYTDREIELLRHEGSGHLTHMWFGGDWPGYERTRIRIYVDEEAAPSIDMELFLGHGIGFADDAAPWGTDRLGKTGQPSGLYNTYRVPFGRRIRITGRLGQGVDKPQTFWWIVRGIEGQPVRWAGITLPDRARLKLQVRENAALAPMQMFEIARSRRAGAVCQVTLAVSSRNFSFLEAMMRAYLNGAGEPLLLSSGTEDYFLGTYYFNRGPYHLPLAGLTHKKQDANGVCSFSAYRFHEDDPIVFQEGLRLVWRNGEEKNGKPYGGTPPQQSRAISYAWFYEW